MNTNDNYCLTLPYFCKSSVALAPPPIGVSGGGIYEGSLGPSTRSHKCLDQWKWCYCCFAQQAGSLDTSTRISATQSCHVNHLGLTLIDTPSHWSWTWGPQNINQHFLDDTVSAHPPSSPFLLTILHTQQCTAHSGDCLSHLSISLCAFTICATIHAWPRSVFLASWPNHALINTWSSSMTSSKNPCEQLLIDFQFPHIQVQDNDFLPCLRSSFAAITSKQICTCCCGSSNATNILCPLMYIMLF